MNNGQLQTTQAAVSPNQPIIQAKLERQAEIVNFLRKKCHPELINVSFSEKHYHGPKALSILEPSKPPLVYPSVIEWQAGGKAIGEFREFIDLQGCVKPDLLNEGNADAILMKLEAAQVHVQQFLLAESASKLTPVFIERGYIPVGILILEKIE